VIESPLPSHQEDTGTLSVCFCRKTCIFLCLGLCQALGIQCSKDKKEKAAVVSPRRPDKQEEPGNGLGMIKFYLELSLGERGRVARSSPRHHLGGASSCLWDHGAMQSGAVCAAWSSGQWLCGKLQKSVAEWPRREGTGARHGLVVSLSGPAAVKGRITKTGSSPPCSPWSAPAHVLPASGQGCESQLSLAARRHPSHGGMSHHRQPNTHCGSATASLGWCRELVSLLIP